MDRGVNEPAFLHGGFSKGGGDIRVWGRHGRPPDQKQDVDQLKKPVFQKKASLRQKECDRGGWTTERREKQLC